jgi:hypothetical protein
MVASISTRDRPDFRDDPISGTVAGRLALTSKKALISSARSAFSAQRFARAARGTRGSGKVKFGDSYRLAKSRDPITWSHWTISRLSSP